MQVQATIMTDPGTADRTYIGPMNAELVEEILEKVRMTQLTEYRYKRTTVPLPFSAGATRCCFTHHGRSNFLESCQGFVRGEHAWQCHICSVLVHSC